MFERLLSLFQSPSSQPEQLPEADAQIALGTLLVRVAMSDRLYLFEEVEQIDRVLAHAFDLKPLEAAKLRATCENFHRELPDSVDLAEVIHRSVDYTHRSDAMSGLWAVARADGLTDEREVALIELVKTQLGVTREDSEAARVAHIVP